VAPTFAAAEVHDDDAVAALGGGVGDVGDAGPAGCQLWAQVEAHVVEVAVREGHGGREHNGLRDGVGGQIHADELRAAGGRGHEGAVGCERAACVEDPESVSWV
jgi:hypothetical protein